MYCPNPMLPQSKPSAIVSHKLTTDQSTEEAGGDVRLTEVWPDTQPAGLIRLLVMLLFRCITALCCPAGQCCICTAHCLHSLLWLHWGLPCGWARDPMPAHTRPSHALQRLQLTPPRPHRDRTRDHQCNTSIKIAGAPERMPFPASRIYRCERRTA